MFTDWFTLNAFQAGCSLTTYGKAENHMDESEQSDSRSAVSDSLWPRPLHSPWSSPGQDTGVGSLSLLRGISPTQDQWAALISNFWL